MITRYREEIPDYALLDPQVLATDVLGVSLDNLDSLLDRVLADGDLDEGALESFRLAAARRVHQGVSIESLLHAYRLWVQIVWRAILDSASPRHREETAAALHLAGHVMNHLNLVSTASTRAYLDELEGFWSDRDVLQRELLEEILAGRGTSPRVADTALAMEVDLWDDYLVVVARRPSLVGGEWAGQALFAARRINRRALDTARALLRPPRGTLLAGIRREEVIALYPLVEDTATERARVQVERLAQTVGREGFAVGLGGPRHGRDQVSQSYQEAHEAAVIAGEGGTFGKPVAFDEVLIDYLLRSNPLSERLAEGTLGRLQEYDRTHHSDLVDTAKSFVSCRFSLMPQTKSTRVNSSIIAGRSAGSF